MAAKIRPATSADAAAIARAHVASWQAAYTGILPGEFLAGLSVERRSLRWADNLAMGNATTVVIETEEGEVAGFASLGPGPQPDVGELYAIYLSPQHWGTGMGRMLMTAAEGELVAGGYRHAILWVFADNPRARRFYESAGWSYDGGMRIEEIGGVQPQQVRYRRRFDQSTQPP